MLKENLRPAMIISRRDAIVLFTRPLSLALLVVSLAVLLLSIRAKHDEVFQE